MTRFLITLGAEGRVATEDNTFRAETREEAELIALDELAFFVGEDRELFHITGCAKEGLIRIEAEEGPAFIVEILEV